MEFSDMPTIGAEADLPLFVLQLGKNDWQYHISRPKGFAKPQIIYCTRGSGTLYVANRVYKIDSGMGFFLPADCPHEYHSDGEVWDTHWLVPEGCECAELLGCIGLDSPQVFRIRDILSLEAAFFRMHSAFAEGGEAAAFAAAEALCDFFELLSVIVEEERAAESSAAVQRALDYIGEHLSESISLDKLSRAAGVSKQHICRLFKSALCRRPSEYITEKRVARAKLLLTQTELPIELIAAQTGFCSSGYFAGRFRRLTGISPAEYRKKEREKCGK